MKKVSDIISKLNLEVVTASEKALDRSVDGAITGDLLSWIMAQGNEGNLWITIQTHQNIIAVAVLLNFSAIIVSGDATIAEDTIEKAIREDIPILRSKMESFEVCGILYNFGVAK